MELVIPRKALLRALARTHAVADRKSSMPILSNLLISTDDEKKSLRISATDLFLAVTASVDATITKTGSAALSARTLFDITKNLPEGDISISILPQHAAEIRSGKVRYKIPGMPAQDFPSLPTPGNSPAIDLEVEKLIELIGQTSYAMSSDETRPHLAAALLEGETDTLRMVTTDGHRLSKAEVPMKISSNFTMLIPAKGIAELKRLVDDAKAEKSGSSALSPVSVTTSGGSAFFRREGVQLSVKLSDEQFPPYRQVIPKSQPKKVLVPRAGLLEALRRISLVASDRSGGVRFSIAPGKLKVESENPDVGEGAEELDVDYAGDELTMGFNARFFADVLASLPDDQVILEFSGELDAGVIRTPRAEQFVGVVMPMRI